MKIIGQQPANTTPFTFGLCHILAQYLLTNLKHILVFYELVVSYVHVATTVIYKFSLFVSSFQDLISNSLILEL
jgi:hypothetical protein